nr:hypothetical protein [Candidatus Microthrix sp.]
MGLMLTTVMPKRLRTLSCSSVFPIIETGGRLDEGEPVIELKPVDHSSGHLMGNPHAHITLGEHHLGGTDPFEDAGVRFGEGLGPDRRDLQVDERSGGQDGCLDVGADGNHRGAHILGADLAQGLQAGGVGLEDVAECAGVVGDEVGVEVDPMTS